MLALVVLMADPSAQSSSERASRAIPLGRADCRGVEQAFARAAAIPLKTRVGPVSAVDQNGPAGDGCLIEGRASGLDRRFDKVLESLVASMASSGWRYDPMADADGPFEAFRVPQARAGPPGVPV